ncbi:MAG: TonB-dependent receptor [Betaproteobacteria bacterium]|nr:TonB-dependent receptor [Betaproteobacteria bacterium]
MRPVPALAFLALAGAAPPALAQAPDDRATPVEGLTVTATRIPQPGFDVPAAIDVVDARAISEGKLQVNLSESLGRVPGIVVQNRQNYAQDLQVSSRGFGARSTFGVRGVRLIADGIPATMPDGQGQAATFALASAERIEVLRGPFSSLYGNASGGVVQVFTRDGPPDPTLGLFLASGSYGTRKAGLLAGTQAGQVNLIGDVSRFETDGYRDHSRAVRDTANVKVAMPLAGGKLTLVANALGQPDTQDPLGLNRAQFEADPRQVDPSAILFDTRKSIRQSQLGAVHELPVTPADSVQVRLYGGTRRVVQFLAQSGDTPLGSGGVVDLDRSYGGVGLRWTHAFALAGGEASLTAGFDRDRLDERRRGFVNDFGSQGALRRDEDDRVANTDFFAQGEWKFAPAWRASLGARRSRVGFESRDYYVGGPNPDDSGSQSYSRTTPVAGLVFQANPRWNVYANAGEGFETPTFAELAYRPGGATGLNFALKPARSRHGEVGVKGRPAEGARVTAALFRIDTRDEIVTNGSSGGRTDFKNASRTRRDGLELSAESRLGAGFEAVVAGTWLDARFTEAFTTGTPAVTVPAGNRLPGVPPVVLHGEVVWRHPVSGFHAGAEVHHAGRVFVNEANVDSAASYTAVNLRVGIESRVAGLVLKAFARVDNVTDRRYAGSVIVAEARGRFFEPAPERNFLVGVTALASF